MTDRESGPSRAGQARAGQGMVFGQAAAQYERVRPSYPREAVDWLLPPGARRVLDLGAGTGKLTRQLPRRGLDVVAVEPSARMREVLTQVLPGVPVLAGSAEQISLDDAAVDVVLVAQAWHWVDVERAVVEVARVLSAGGRLGLVWNVRDEREDWVRQLGRILAPHTKPDVNSVAPRVGPPFGPLERFDVAWGNAVSSAQVIELVASRSYVITLPPQERARVLAEVQDLLDTHPALRGRARIRIPYLTHCFRTTLQP